MKQFKLGFGPMSNEIIEALAKYSHEEEYPIMIIASRNQVDIDGGYVCTSSELVEKVKEYKTDKLLVCRDHCGPYFADADKGLGLADTIARCKQTIKADIEAGFDLIHIDVSRIEENQLDYGKELIDYALSLNPSIKLEFGSEDNTGVDVASSIGRLEPQLEFLQQYKDNVVFFVSQTGSLTKDGQVGSFDVEVNKQVGQQIRDAGFLFKEHNGDYFTEADIANRIAGGVDSINIAPQLGKIQTDLTKEFASDDLWTAFADHVYAQNKWQRWVEPGVTDKDIAVSVSGHYCFTSDQYRAILASIDYELFKEKLQAKITELLDFYQTFDHENEDVQFKQVLKKRLADLRARDPFIYR